MAPKQAAANNSKGVPGTKGKMNATTPTTVKMPPKTDRTVFLTAFMDKTLRNASNNYTVLLAGCPTVGEIPRNIAISSKL